MLPVVLGLITARGGSRGIPGKNISLVAGKPMIAWTIQAALECHSLNRVILSSDDAEIAEIGRKWRAEVPFMRPAELAQDNSPHIDAILHAVEWLEENENYIPDICVHLRPTYPVRKVEDIDKVIQILLDSPDIDSVRSVAPAPDTPFKMWFREESGLLSPVVKTDIKDAYNLPRQILPQAFLQNACIDAVRTSVITKKKSMTGQRIYGYLMEDNFDIDDQVQLRKAEEQLPGDNVGKQKEGNLTFNANQRKTFCFDIDGIIATITPGNQYDLAEPQPENIRAINNLYEQGHRIILCTARGSATGIDWSEVTRNQLKAWGVKYHELVFGKPAADYYIDDKSLSTEQLQTLISE